MQITLVPIRMDAALDVAVKGDCLVLNGQPVDLSGVPEGGRVDAAEIGCDWVVGDVVRQKGELSVFLILPLAAEAPEGARFPAPLRVSRDGPVELPKAEAPAPLEAPDLVPGAEAV